MPVLKIKKDGVWEEIDGVSNHTHPEYASTAMFGELQTAVENLHDQKSDIDHQHTASEVGALSISGGVMEDTLTVKGIVLTEGIDYGPEDPSGGVIGQLYFKKVTT